MHDAFNIKA